MKSIYIIDDNGKAHSYDIPKFTAVKTALKAQLTRLYVALIAVQTWVVLQVVTVYSFVTTPFKKTEKPEVITLSESRDVNKLKPRPAWRDALKTVKIAGTLGIVMFIAIGVGMVTTESNFSMIISELRYMAGAPWYSDEVLTHWVRKAFSLFS